MWKLLHGILPTNEMIYRRTGKGDPICFECGDVLKPLNIFCFLCTNVDMVWKLFPIQWEGLTQDRWCIWRWWGKLAEAAKNSTRKEHVEATIYQLWQLWKSRNDWRFNQKETPADFMARRAIDEWNKFLNRNKLTEARREDIHHEDNLRVGTSFWNLFKQSEGL
ncbi:hypothetical protein ACH5RR_025979 [Cinchona calisaya]|uniref:Uncharacterized protein n=1 Tax=Cinchona calisaya TaxID=153742 RepID=A0ABD2Z4E4_9GENT